MKSSGHDTLAYRLAEILIKLNQEESFSLEELAVEFGVSERTIYRDMNRLAGIAEPLGDGRYQLAPTYRGRLKPKDLATFAKLTGVDQLFPNSTPRFLVALLETLSQGSILVRGHHYELLKPHDLQFQQLEDAVRQHKCCTFTYADKRRTVAPYRLVNNKGIWYLAASENGQLKSYALSRIVNLNVNDETFAPRQDIHRQIDDDDDVWFTQEKTEVLLSVAPQAAYYFQRRKLLPQQTTVKSLENGGLIVSSHIGHANQILPSIRYWIPHVKILEPVWLKEAMDGELREYLK
ncbi:WYL domain-containing protein [Dyella jejuensis]|uniref:WYL domain-containing protein n=1 Tax=Dyella jejuensis TaxID=1432009 RepID=A0ABW8JGI2_9GAMM